MNKNLRVGFKGVASLLVLGLPLIDSVSAEYLDIPTSAYSFQSSSELAEEPRFRSCSHKLSGNAFILPNLECPGGDSPERCNQACIAGVIDCGQALLENNKCCHPRMLDEDCNAQLIEQLQSYHACVLIYKAAYWVCRAVR